MTGRPARRRGAIWLALALVAPVLAWSGGLLWYLHLIDTIPPPPPPSDGIVALTGGAGRVEAALRLLDQGRARELLLSGIGGGAELAELAARAGVDPAPLAGRVTVGRLARNTLGNARETADWARQHGLHSLIVVTAAYHMPRALIELGRAMPEIAMHPVPVVPPGFTGWRRLRLAAEEFTKFLVARAGLSTLFPDRSPPGKRQKF